MPINENAYNRRTVSRRVRPSIPVENYKTVCIFVLKTCREFTVGARADRTLVTLWPAGRISRSADRANPRTRSHVPPGHGARRRYRRNGRETTGRTGNDRTDRKRTDGGGEEFGGGPVSLGRVNFFDISTGIRTHNIIGGNRTRDSARLQTRTAGETTVCVRVDEKAR